MSNFPDVRSEIDPGSTANAAKADAAFLTIGDSMQVYNETAFRHFLTIERDRSTRSGRPLLLLLVDTSGESGRKVPMDRGVAERVFAALGHCLRETDFTGWYVENLTAGAVLTQRSRKPVLDDAPRVRDRVMRAIREHCSTTGLRVHVQFYQLPSGLKGRLTAWR